MMLVLVLGCPPPSAVAADPVLGLADDGALVTNPVDPDGVLRVGAAHGATFVRLVAYMGSYPHDDRYLQAAEHVAARGLGLDVVLALPWGHAQDGVTPPQFAAWAAQLAVRLAAVGQRGGVPLRLSILNEPDLFLKASDECDAATVRVIVRQAGYVPTATRTRVKVRRTRFVRRVTRRNGRRRVTRQRLVWTRYRWETSTTLGATEMSTDQSALTVERGCLSIMRARRAAEFLNAAGVTP